MKNEKKYHSVKIFSRKKHDIQHLLEEKRNDVNNLAQ